MYFPEHFKSIVLGVALSDFVDTDTREAHQWSLQRRCVVSQDGARLRTHDGVQHGSHLFLGFWRKTRLVTSRISKKCVCVHSQKHFQTCIVRVLNRWKTPLFRDLTSLTVKIQAHFPPDFVDSAHLFLKSDTIIDLRGVSNSHK